MQPDLWIRLMRTLTAAVSLIFSVGMLGAQVSSVQVIGSTNVQAVLSYQASNESSCSVQVSENPDFHPLVHDVDPVLFPGADSDARDGNLNNGRNRIFIAGKRAVHQATDKKWYSLALQTDTMHYFRIRCGADEASGSFRTANIPVGTSYPWPIPQDPQTGNFRWPSVDNGDRNQTIIDPNYGTLIRRVTVPGEGGGRNWMNTTFSSAAGNNWTNPAGSLKNDGDAAQYSGTSRDWLVLTNAELDVLPYLVTGQSIDSVVVHIQGSGQGSTMDDRSIDVCLTADGSTCRGEIRSVALDDHESVKTLGSSTGVDTWEAPLWEDELKNQTFGVMIRSSSAAGVPLSIQAVTVDITNSGMGSLPENGFLTTCAPVKSNGGFHCAFRSFGGNGASALYWIQPETGEVRSLGPIVASGWGGASVQCAGNWAAFDAADPNTYYCAPRPNGKTFLLKGTYTGNDVAAKPRENAQMTWTNVTPEPNTISDLLQAFDPEFQPGAFHCGLVSLADNDALFTCKMGIQDSIGWLGVFDLGNGQPLGSGGTGRIVAAAKSFASANTRWCGIHATEPLERAGWFGWGAERLTGGGGVGTGPYSVTLAADVPAATGHLTLQVSGEPQPYLMDVQEGDIFQFADRPSAFDIVVVTKKISPTQWEVDRHVPYNGAVVAVPAGTRLDAFCNGVKLDDPKPGVQAYWNFLADPHGQGRTNSMWVAEKILTGGHLTQRGDYRIMVGHKGYQIITPGIPASLNQPVSFTIVGNPRWKGVRAGVGLGNDELEGVTNTYQAHPSYENFRNPDRSNWYVDLIPFVGLPGLTSGLSAVSGYSQVYQVRGTQLHRNVFPTFAICSGQQLKDLSPGPIKDADRYSYCVGSDCVSGAGSQDVFLNCPAPVSTASRCSQSLAGDDSSVCVGDLPPYGQSVTQFFLDRSGMRNRVLTNGLLPWQSRRTPMPLTTASPLPDGSWVLFPSYGSGARRDVFMVKVPPAPEFNQDPGAWTKPVPVTAAATPTAPGVARAVMQYGATPDLGSSMTLASCQKGSPCSATVMISPLGLFFSRMTFQDAGGNVLEQAPLEVHISSGIEGSGTGKPLVSGANIVNAASLVQNLAPGSVVTIFGDQLADCTERSTAFPLPSSLCNAGVTFNGQPGLLLYASPNQLNVLLPSSLLPDQNLQVIVSRLGVASDPVTVAGMAMAPVAPAVYAFQDGTVRRGLIRNADGTYSGPTSLGSSYRPSKLGEAVTVFVNGLGPVNPSVPDGQAAPADVPSAVAATVTVVVNDIPQTVAFAGLAPGLSGIYQVNFTINPATPINAGDQNTLRIRIQGVDSPPVVASLQPGL